MPDLAGQRMRLTLYTVDEPGKLAYRGLADTSQRNWGFACVTCI